MTRMRVCPGLASSILTSKSLDCEASVYKLPVEIVTVCKTKKKENMESFPRRAVLQRPVMCGEYLGTALKAVRMNMSKQKLSEITKTWQLRKRA